MNYALQKAIVTKLAAYGATSGYTVVSGSRHTDLPFVEIGYASRTEIGPADRLVFEDSVDLDVWCDTNSGFTAHTMTENLIDAMRDSVLDGTSDGYYILGKPEVAQSVLTTIRSPVTDEEVIKIRTTFLFFTQKI